MASFSLEYTLKITKIELKLLKDVNMILDYENGIRGRITRAICQCGETKDTMHGYDETRESA